VPDELLAKIFDPFFTTKEVGKGTGLGLTVAYAIVQEHGGRITAHSKSGSGATFRIELPTASVRTAQALAAKTPVEIENVGGGAAVLVIEDEPALATAVAEGLSDAGFLVTRAADGEEGLARLRERTFDVIVCDLRMPRLDGPAFYRAIAASSPSLARRVIFVTGDVAGTDAERFLEDSGCRWLPKPFRLADLLRAAREVMG
jgi:CheY-like chemotaxis protein